ncbi:MAG: circularly permuted type 2 ATP-grasp protein [Pseudomonadota bacterium]
MNATQPTPLFRYRAPVGGYDEAAVGAQLRPHWQRLFHSLAAGPDGSSGVLASVATDIQRQLSETSFDASTTTADRPWRLDALPLIMDDQEWTRLEAGLLQRCRLLNAILKDFYGSQSMLNSGVLPPALVFANPAFALPACGTLRATEALRFLAFDLGRSADGQWWVLNNRCEAPKGLGYLLENRIVMARCLPELMAAERIERLAPFYQSMNDSLRQPAQGDSLTVLLTGGPQSPDYAEQAYLGRYLGLPVIEGDDLTVRDDQLYLKTLEGLQGVRSVVRSVSSDLCDPLELRHDSLLGTPGLLNVVRAGNVTISNTIGSGVVENDAILAFLPGLCELLLEEPLALPSIASWWCGQPNAARHVLDNLDSLVLRDAFRKKALLTASVSDYLASDIKPATKKKLAQALQQQPHLFVGRDSIRVSTVPYFDPNRGVLSAPMTLRLYAAWTEQGYRLLPGGLARVAAQDGDVTKDVWVRQRSERPTTTPVRKARQRQRGERNLPSRTADDLFWLGRYQERTEGAVRLYRALLRDLVVDGNSTDQPIALSQITRLLVSMHTLSNRRAAKLTEDGPRAVRQELWNLLLDSDSEDGLATLLRNVHRTAQRLQSRLSQDTWRLYDRLAQLPNLRWRVHGTSEVLQLLDDMIDKLAALAGKTSETMTRGNGWRLMEIGKHIERIRFMARLLRDLSAVPENDSVGIQVLALDISDGTLTHRSRHRGLPSPYTVVDLLLLDPSHPRSIAYQVSELLQLLADLPRERSDEVVSSGRRALLSLQNELMLADIDVLIDNLTKAGRRHRLERLLRISESTANEVSAFLSRTYFAHTQQTRR